MCTCDNDFSYVYIYDRGKRHAQVYARGTCAEVVPRCYGAAVVTCEVYTNAAQSRTGYLCVGICTPTARFRPRVSRRVRRVKCYKTEISGRDVKRRRLSFESRYRGARNPSPDGRGASRKRKANVVSCSCVTRWFCHGTQKPFLRRYFYFFGENVHAKHVCVCVSPPNGLAIEREQ